MNPSKVLVVAGIFLLGYAFSLAPYEDEILFNKRYNAMSAGQSAEYWKLRDEMLTPKYMAQDYGITLVAAGIVVLGVSRKGWRRLKSPRSRLALFGLAVAAPLTFVGAYIYDLLLAHSRGEFPHWADSLGIPLAGVPFLLLVALVWSTGHLAFVRVAYRPVPLALTLSNGSNYWLLAASAVTCLLAAFSILLGQYWYAIPYMLWLFYFMSLAAARHASSVAEPCTGSGRIH